MHAYFWCLKHIFPKPEKLSMPEMSSLWICHPIFVHFPDPLCVFKQEIDLAVIQYAYTNVFFLCCQMFQTN